MQATIIVLPSDKVQLIITFMMNYSPDYFLHQAIYIK